MTSPLGPGGVVELAVVERSGFPESRHLGAAVLTDRNGDPVRELGDVRAAVLPRSSLKPFQALASLRNGAALTGAHLAVAVASHVGTLAHVHLVRDVLTQAGLDESALRCVPAWPLDRSSRDLLVTLGDRPRSATMTCSGKHAAFLVACAASGWSTQDYLEPDHPIQHAVRDTVSELTGEPVAFSGIDGCGAPVHATSIAGIARGISALVRGAAPAGPQGRAILSAALQHPWAVEGRGRPDSVVIQQLQLFAKTGTEGFMLMAAPTGEAVAVKFLDGASRAATLVGLELLAQGGVIRRADAERVTQLTTPLVMGGGDPVGRIRAAF